MINKITKQLYAYALLIVASFTAIMGVAGCSDDSESSTAEYGYVQFKLFKEASYNKSETESRATSLDKLSDAHKISVVMQHEGHTITQSLVLNSYDNDNAEYGLRSDKLQLLVGDYTIIGYFLYDNLDNEIYAGNPTADNSFTVIHNGLVIKELTANVTPKGKATFRLVKNFVESRTTDEAYPLDNVKVVDIAIRNVATLEEIEIKKIKVEFEQTFTEDHIKTSYSTCDTIVWLKAGTYKVSRYITYSDKNGKTTLEVASPKSDKTFTISDNKVTENIEVPITLSYSDEYIKDYLALKEIWEAMDGPNWRYYGEAAQNGANWNFNKDVDLWGDQPGVTLHNDGRVASLTLAGMGAKGVVPDAIGQLTEMEVLALGTHDELLGGHLFEDINGSTSAEQLNRIRHDYEEKFLKRDIREGLSDILQEGINRNPEMKPIRYSSNRINTKDVQFGSYTNQITGVSKAMMRLTNLQQFYIANSPITHDGFFVEIGEESPFYAERNELSWSDLKTLTDIEIYNCPKLTALPMEFLGTLPEIQLLNIACNKSISAEQLKSDWEALIDGKSGNKIQLLYMGYNNLKEFPETSYLRRMTQLSMLDCTNNQIEIVHPFGKEINLTKLYLDYNKIKEIKPDEEGYFFGYYDVESFTCAYNELTELPDIFNANSIYVMGSIDFSNNKISSVANGKNFRGYNCSTLSLAYNNFDKMPAEIMQSGSPISTLNMAGNGMTEIPEGSLTGKYSYGLLTIDLSYNKLKKLPKDFYARNMPYIYGIDVSYNCFSEFPYEPFDGAYITTFGIRHQRDEQGNRTLKEWPTGIYQSPSMVALYIGSNDLRKIEDTISPYIRILEIKDNPNISIDVTDVCSYIQYGYYMLIYDKTQDIRGCDYLDLE